MSAGGTFLSSRVQRLAVWLCSLQRLLATRVERQKQHPPPPAPFPILRHPRRGPHGTETFAPIQLRSSTSSSPRPLDLPTPPRSCELFWPVVLVLCGLNNRNVYSHSPGGCESKAKALVSPAPSLHGLQMVIFSLWPHTALAPSRALVSLPLRAPFVLD